MIDLRWLDRASLDWDTIEASIKKTNKVLIVEQGSLQTSYGGWLADEIQRRYFDWLDAPVTWLGVHKIFEGLRRLLFVHRVLVDDLPQGKQILLQHAFLGTQNRAVIDRQGD